MQIGFICPDGQKTKFEECFKECRMKERCVTLPTLKVISQQREWTGKPHVTQCLKGTLEAYRLIVIPYYVSPQRAAFRLLGSNHHKLLEAPADLPVLDEQLFSEDDAESQGQPDLWDDGTLTDYKTWGSFKVAKALGLYKVDVPTGEIYKSGAKKGQPKTRKETRQSNDKIDMDDAIYQINRYRIFYEDAGFKVKKMQVQATVRDGGLMAAQRTGVDRNIYVIPIPLLEDRQVLEYFGEKSRRLIEAMTEGFCKPEYFCAKEECWNGRKCEGYCDVSEGCPLLEGMKTTEKDGEDNDTGENS